MYRSTADSVYSESNAYKEICGEACIKASWFGRKTINILHIYMYGVSSSHRQQRPVGRHSVCAPHLPSDVPPVESTGASHLSSQSRPAATVASAALHGQNLRLPPATTPALSATPAWDPFGAQSVTVMSFLFLCLIQLIHHWA